jgi:hypothetical protein
MTAIEQRNSRRFRRYILLAGVIAVVLVGAGLVWYDYRFPSWQEEVLLPDGRMIVVKQRRDFIEGYGTRRTWLTFSLPEMGGERTWSEWLYPTMIGAASGNVYVIGRPRGSTQFSMYAFPRHTYVAYQWRADKFERIPFLDVPELLRLKENVRWCLPGGADSKIIVPGAAWCLERLGPHDKFPMPQLVDLSVREAEAIDWARSAGQQPASD